MGACTEVGTVLDSKATLFKRPAAAGHTNKTANILKRPAAAPTKLGAEEEEEETTAAEEEEEEVDEDEHEGGEEEHQEEPDAEVEVDADVSD